MARPQPLGRLARLPLPARPSRRRWILPGGECRSGGRPCTESPSAAGVREVARVGAVIFLVALAVGAPPESCPSASSEVPTRDRPGGGVPSAARAMRPMISSSVGGTPVWNQRSISAVSRAGMGLYAERGTSGPGGGGGDGTGSRLFRLPLNFGSFASASASSSSSGDVASTGMGRRRPSGRRRTSSRARVSIARNGKASLYRRRARISSVFIDSGSIR